MSTTRSKQSKGKQINYTQDYSFFQGKKMSCPGIQTNDTRRVLNQLTYQDNISWHNTIKPLFSNHNISN